VYNILHKTLYDRPNKILKGLFLDMSKTLSCYGESIPTRNPLGVTNAGLPLSDAKVDGN